MIKTLTLFKGGFMKKLLETGVVFIVIVLVTAFYFGCASSEETQQEIQPPTPSELDIAKQKIDALNNENSELKKKIANLEQNTRNLRAKAAELETRLNEEREKAKFVSPPSQPKPTIKDDDAEYQDALTLFNQNKYKESAAKFLELINRGIKKELEDNCYYWLGESYFGMKDYTTAIGYFEKVFTYKISEKKDESAIMIANCYWDMGKKKEAIKEYKNFLEKFPASPYVKRAKARSGE